MGKIGWPLISMPDFHKNDSLFFSIHFRFLTSFEHNRDIDYDILELLI